MKLYRSLLRFTIMLGIVCAGRATLSAQPKQVYTLNADSTKLTSCDSNELIIENHTKTVLGFLYNTGNGRTIFKKALTKVNDTIYLIGGIR